MSKFWIGNFPSSHGGGTPLSFVSFPGGIFCDVYIGDVNLAIHKKSQWFTLPVKKNTSTYKEIIDENKTGWSFQPIWKILVKLEILHK